MRQKNKGKNAKTGRAPAGMARRERQSRKARGGNIAKARGGRELVTGRYSGSQQGYGFLTPEEKGKYKEDIFIPARAVHGALDGDTVRARVRRGEDGRYDGEIAEITNHANSSVIGTLCHLDGGWQVIPQSRKLAVDIFTDPPREAEEGDLVKCEIAVFPTHSKSVRAKITEIFGKAGTKDANYGAILAENGIQIDFSDEAIDCAERAAAEPLSAAGRLDLRDSLILTVDGAGAKDLDDAVSLESTDGGFLLSVHIADVSHYVREKTALDREAMARGTSVYFTDKVVPMLPVCLSNGACSLNAGEDKYALSARISLDKNGKITACEPAHSIIRSTVRGVYSEVNDLFEKGKKSEFYGKYKAVYKMLCEMRGLYEILEANAHARGSLELDSTDAEIILDESGAPVAVVKRERGVGERLIEQFMLTANEAVARFLSERKLPCVYRIHEDPDTDKIRAFKVFAQNLGLDATRVTAEAPSPKQLSHLLTEAKEKDKLGVVSGVLLRSLMKAKYSEIRSRHFGLALDYYCHFTSPIRRYPDLSVHRIISGYLDGVDAAKKYASFARKSAARSSENELRALTAERAIDDMYKVIYLSSHIGEEFDATVASVTSFGLFVALDDTCEGLVPLSTIEGDFKYDEELYTLVSADKTYRLGDRVRVMITDTDLVRRRVTMKIV